LVNFLWLKAFYIYCIIRVKFERSLTLEYLNFGVINFEHKNIQWKRKFVSMCNIFLICKYYYYLTSIYTSRRKILIFILYFCFLSKTDRQFYVHTCMLRDTYILNTILSLKRISRIYNRHSFVYDEVCYMQICMLWFIFSFMVTWRNFCLRKYIYIIIYIYIYIYWWHPQITLSKNKLNYLSQILRS